MDEMNQMMQRALIQLTWYTAHYKESKNRA